MKEQKEKFKYNENNKLACELAQIHAENYVINENYKKIEKQLTNARSTIQL